MSGQKKKEADQAALRAALKAHVKEQQKLDAAQIKLVKRAHLVGVPLQ